jgi:hypothetical protein
VPTVLTSASTLVCPHQGTIQLIATQTKLKVGSDAVLVVGDLEGKVISGCTVTPSPSTKPCLTVTSMILGAAVKLTADGKPVLLDTATGLTDGVPPSTWSVQTSGQTKLSSD